MTKFRRLLMRACGAEIAMLVACIAFVIAAMLWIAAFFAATL